MTGNGSRTAVRVVALVTILGFLAAVVAGLIFWGIRYGAVAAMVLTLYVAVPLWVASRFIDIDPRWAPTRRRLRGVLIAAALLLWIGFAAVGSFELAFEGEAMSPLTLIAFALLAAVGVVGPAALFAFSLVRADRDGSPFLEPTVARGVVLGLAGTVLGVSVLFLLAAPFAMWAEPYSMSNYRGGFTRLAGAYMWIVLAAVSLAAAYPAAWAFGLVQTGFLSASYAAAKARRREATERLRGRLDDHYALHRVHPATHQALRTRLLQERDGQVPGETRYIAARGVITRVSVLGVLLLVTVGLVLAGAGQSKEWNAEAVAGDEPGLPYWPCTDCETAAEYEAFLDQVQDWRTWTYLLLLAIGALGVFMLLLVPYLLRIMRAAQDEAARFWSERDRLESQMLEEVRASTASAPP